MERDDFNNRFFYNEMRLLSEGGSTLENSQQSLACRLGIALGMSNYLLRDLTQTGGGAGYTAYAG